jgi:Type IV pili methyl-accepting chemotaxis transducer N-term
MLSQRIIKAWLQILGGIALEASQKILNDSILLFDVRLSELQLYATATKNVSVSIQYDVLENEWSELKRIIRRNVPSAAMIPTLIPKSDQIRNLANYAVDEFEKNSSVPANRIVNIAGRQRMLSQIVTRELILARIPGQPRGLSTTLIESAKLFRTTHQELLAHPGNTGAIKSQLELTGMLWVFFENALLGKVPEIPNQIASASENLLKTLDSLVLLYEKI